MIIIRAKTIHENNTIDIVLDKVEYMVHYTHQFTQHEAGIPATRVHLKSGTQTPAVYSIKDKVQQRLGSVKVADYSK